MSNIFLVKRSTVNVAPASLQHGELAFGSLGELFIGNASGAPVKIAGVGFATEAFVNGVAASTLSSAQSYTDTAVAALSSSTTASVADLQSQINAEVSRATAAEAATLASAQSYTDSKISDLVGAAPSVLDTLAEIAAALGQDPNLATTLTTQIAGVQSSVDAEVARATAAEAALQTAIDNLQTAAGAEIDAEVQARIAADNYLQGLINTEIADRIANDIRRIASSGSET